jgi:guanine nucleotide-binding protein subunit alpha
MTLIHGKGYTDEQKLSFKECIFSNTIVSIQVILQAMEALEIVLNDDANAVHRDVILNFDQVLDCDCLPPEVIKAIQELWKDSGVQHCYSRSREYQLNDSAE